ncbi:hypothetical protein A33M_0660 [Rhodovulum sp. PH10]|uniref:hypothetical protein n=1 Tax=Rhodovulum sp. PH10 TaxID=1187851 RepID=UPI00027C2BD5|nr:hypothetical protein [Rhodovulum sp. PH10]EJW10041.1 hypothetical protein A33M_0660 [Rhodovulum sp. PH10]
MIRFGTLSATLVVLGTLAQPALARTPYDGSWSVLIITDRGSCDRAYRYAIDIDGGIIRYAGQMGMNFDGRVGRGGRVRVNVSAGGSAASGSGRLGRDYGGGVWRGRGATGSCSGRWTAERR